MPAYRSVPSKTLSRPLETRFGTEHAIITQILRRHEISSKRCEKLDVYKKLTYDIPKDKGISVVRHKSRLVQKLSNMIIWIVLSVTWDSLNFVTEKAV